LKIFFHRGESEIGVLIGPFYIARVFCIDISMYQRVFNDNINDDELSPLENFTPLMDLIQAGGIKAERARKIMNQFSSTASLKTRDTIPDVASAAPTSKKAKYYGARRFKN